MIESKYPLASARQLFSISFPLMLTMFSTTFMILCNRLILSYYSVDAMNAITIIGNIHAIIQFAGIKIAYIAEVFVGQYNGAKKYNQVARPVWQMIWFSLLMFLATIPIALYTGPLIIPEKFEIIGDFYYKLLIATAPLLALTVALISFYVGRGKVRFITYIVILGNIINIVLDLILILGVKDFIPPLGTKGAAISTLIAVMAQVIILFIDFLRPHNNDKFKTREYGFDKKLFLNCLRLGIPNAAGLILDISAWTVLLLMLAYIEPEYVTVHSVALTIFIFFTFFFDGLQKGITAIAANIIGAKKFQFLNKLLRSTFKLYFVIIFILFFPLVALPEYTVDMFFREKMNSYITKETIYALKFVWLFLIVDGIFWSYIGILTAAGDTRFIMLVYSPSILLLLVPIYILVHYFHAHPSSLWIVIAVYKIIPVIIFIWRYRSQRWKKMSL